jgi:hypothetical protein
MIEEFIRNLVVTYVPEFMIRSMVQVMFISGCVSVILVMLSIGSFFMNMSSLVDRLLPIRKVEVVKGDSLWVRIKSSKLGAKVFGKAS